MKPDTRDKLAKVQNDWVTTVAQARQARQDAVMEALDEGDTKYAIAQAMGVRGPTVDSIIATATREPKAPERPQAER
jgi:DNA-binding NarL/FixJ family response regulator